MGKVYLFHPEFLGAVISIPTIIYMQGTQLDLGLQFLETTTVQLLQGGECKFK